MPSSRGRLESHHFKSNHDLSALASWDLGCALLARLETEADYPTLAQYQAHMALFEALHDILDARRDVWQNPFAVGKAEVFFRIIAHGIRNFGLPIQGATYVDLGCGALNPFGRLFPLLMLGARRALCFELDPIHDLGKGLRYLAAVASAALTDPRRVYGDHPVNRMELLANVADFDFAKLAQGDASGVPADRVQLFAKSIDATGLPAASADVLLSNSVLEHLPDLDAAVAEFARITRVGGFGLHGIDLTDHRHYSDPRLHPLEFLTIASKERIVFESNRLRLHDAEQCFVAHGFEVLDRLPGPKLDVPDALRARMAEPWRTMPRERLEFGWVQLIVRRR